MISAIIPTQREDFKVGMRVRYNERFGTIIANDFYNAMPETKLDGTPENEIALIPWQRLRIIKESKK